MDSQRSHIHKPSSRIDWIFRKYRQEQVELDVIDIDSVAQAGDESDDDIPPDRPGRIVARPPPPVWQDLDLQDAFARRNR